MVILPLESFNLDILNALLEDIVSRDGTDYGEIELRQEEKVSQLLVSLKLKKAFVGFDAISETCIILAADQASEMGLLDYE